MNKKGISLIQNCENGFLILNYDKIYTQERTGLKLEMLKKKVKFAIQG